MVLLCKDKHFFLLGHIPRENYCLGVHFFYFLTATVPHAAFEWTWGTVVAWHLCLRPDFKGRGTYFLIYFTPLSTYTPFGSDWNMEAGPT